MSKTADGKTITYVNDITAAYTQVLQTYDENGAVLNTYDYGVNRIRSRGETDETYLYDGHGSVVGTVNPKAGLISYRYTAYGDLAPSSPTPSVFGYNAEDTDYSTGMQYLRARYYDVNLGRFVQKDEFKGDSAQPTTLNRYAYCRNNPIAFSDPSGYLFKAIGSRISSIASSVVKNVSTRVNTAKQIASRVKSSVVSGIKKAASIVVPVASKIVGSVIRTYSKIAQNASQIINTAKSNPKQAVNDFKAAASRGVSYLQSTLNNLKPDLKNAASDLVGVYTSTAKDVNDIILNETYKALDNFPPELKKEAMDKIKADQAAGVLTPAKLSQYLGEVCAKALAKDTEQAIDDLKVLTVGSGTFSSKEDALRDFYEHAMRFTDENNLEYCATLYGENGNYSYSPINEGGVRTVWPYPVSNALVSLIAKSGALFSGASLFEADSKDLMHTHPDAKPWDNLHFSGIPGVFTLSAIGDTDVVDVLGYDSIYLDTKDGNLFQYSGVGTGSNQLNVGDDTSKLKVVATGYPTLNYHYEKDSNGNYVIVP